MTTYLSVEQQLLLKAAYLSSPDDLAAWQDCRIALEKDSLSCANHYVLPLIFPKLVEAEIEEPSIGTIKGYTRFAWCRNQVKFQTATRVIEALQNNQIDLIVLKKMALKLWLTKEKEGTTAYEFSLLLAQEKVISAIQFLHSLGWVNKIDVSETTFNRVNSLSLSHEKEGEISLVWRTDLGRSSLDFTKLLGRGTTTLPLNHLSVKVPHVSDLLLLQITEMTSTLNCASDLVQLVQLVQKQGKFADFKQSLKTSRITLILRENIEYLQQLPHMDELIKIIDNTPITMQEKIACAQIKSPILKRAAFRYQEYNKIKETREGLSLSQYLQETWQVNSMLEIIYQIIIRSWSKIKQK